MLFYACYVVLQNEKLGQHYSAIVLRKRVIKYPCFISKNMKVHISANL